jgi:hypothetical protein
VQVSILPNPTEHVLWEGIKELLKPAADYGEIPVFSGDETVWVAFEGQIVFAAATTIAWNDGEAEILLCSGTGLKDWISGVERMSAWARDCGAKRLIMRGRKGWARALRAFGWAPLGIEDGRTLYEKVL